MIKYTVKIPEKIIQKYRQKYETVHDDWSNRETLIRAIGDSLLYAICDADILTEQDLNGRELIYEEVNSTTYKIKY